MTNISYTVINVRIDLDHSMSAHEISYHLNCDCRQEISLNVRLNLLYQTRFESLGPRLVHIARCNFYVWNTQRNFRRWFLVYVVILQREKNSILNDLLKYQWTWKNVLFYFASVVYPSSYFGLLSLNSRCLGLEILFIRKQKHYS